MTPPELQHARRLVRRARRIVGFTGAGISTESAIPDFRSPGGVWSRYRMVTYQEFLANEEDRIEYWRQKFAAWPAIRDARPNQGHEALVELHRQGRLAALITQNIDGLHQGSGIPAEKVLELHGNATEAACLTCEARVSAAEVAARIEAGEAVPRCRLPRPRRSSPNTPARPTADTSPCDGLLKPTTISFGQILPQDVLSRAWAAAGACDAMLVVGSSLVVHPAADLPRFAHDAGADVIILNREPTPLDHIASAVIHAEIGEVLPTLVAR